MRQLTNTSFQVNFHHKRGSGDPLNQTWLLSVQSEDTEYQRHTYSIEGTDVVRAPTPEVLAMHLLSVLKAGLPE